MAINKKTETSTKDLYKVIAASSVGTMIEWYDFYIFGSLASVISVHFFPKDNPVAALLSTLAVFAAGFVVRPFGAMFFGRLGDMMGRKYTFFVTLLLMGGSTFIIGLIPGYETIGILAPILVLILRLLQGLALGGEYGGAVIYVGEYSPYGRRGYFTSWIQTTATIGLLISLIVIQVTKNSMALEDFTAWGWRIPFLISIFLLMISAYIRYNMQESPLFIKLKAVGQTSKNPIKESFTHKENIKFVVLAMLGAVMGQGVVWYTAQFYSLSFIRDQGLDFNQSTNVALIALTLATPFFLFFGYLSDRMGRKWIMVASLLLSALSYRPIYNEMYNIIHVTGQMPVATSTGEETKVTTDGVDFKLRTDLLTYADGSVVTQIVKQNLSTSETTQTKTIKLGSSFWTLMWLIFIQVIYVTMIYGPIAAFLVDLFPTKIRYTSMSLPYHIGTGIFGGLVPFTSTALVIQAQALGKNQAYLEGLWYPIFISLLCAVICIFYVSNKAHKRGTD